MLAVASAPRASRLTRPPSSRSGLGSSRRSRRPCSSGRRLPMKVLWWAIVVYGRATLDGPWEFTLEEQRERANISWARALAILLLGVCVDFLSTRPRTRNFSSRWSAFLGTHGRRASCEERRRRDRRSSQCRRRCRCWTERRAVASRSQKTKQRRAVANRSQRRKQKRAVANRSQRTEKRAVANRSQRTEKRAVANRSQREREREMPGQCRKA